MSERIRNEFDPNEESWNEIDQDLIKPVDNSFDENLLKIGFLYAHPFGSRVINNLINKNGFCTKCGPLCINCRVIYKWFANKIYYAYQIKRGCIRDIDSCWDKIEEKLSPLDVLIVIGVPKEILMDIPELAYDYNIRAVIFPVEDPLWISANEQIGLESKLKNYGIEFSFPRPFCSLKPDKDHPDSIITQFIYQFRIGYPEIEFGLQGDKIIKTKITRSAPCGATYFVAQYLRNEQFNTYNQESLDKRINTALRLYPCTASKERDPIIQMSERFMAEKIAQETIHTALMNAEKNL